MVDLLLKADNAASAALCNIEDPFRLKYHISPAVGLLNDPNGFIEHKGIYHLFYQWNPFECAHGSKFWAHCISDDLVNWRLLPTAMAPDQDYDKNGCYSGSAFVDNEKLMLFYTGNVKNKDGTRLSTQCIAEANSLNDKFIKKGPVIDSPPAGYTAHFRDPKIWHDNGVWYCVIGAQTIDKKGQILLYRATKLNDWELMGPLAGSGLNELGYFGYMWECPDFFELDNNHILICSPQGIEKEGDKYHNKYQSGYFIGSYNIQAHEFKHNEFIELDRGFEFYAPQTTTDSKGRRLMSAWMGIPEEDEQPTLAYNWLHALTLVRELKIKNGRLYQYPVEELKQLRKNQLSYQDILVSNSQSFTQIHTPCCEIEIELNDIQGKCGVHFNAYDHYHIDLTFNPNNRKLSLDRNSTPNQSGVRSCTLLSKQSLKLHMFLDKSSIEIFVNNGEEVFTSRVFPLSEARNISIYSHGSCTIARFDKYDLS